LCEFRKSLPRIVLSIGYFFFIYLLTAIGLTPGGSNTVHIYTKTVHRTTQWNPIHRTEHT